MTNREDRVAQNQATSREINEGIETAHSEVPPEGHVRMLCECGREQCERVIAISMGEYEEIRRDPRHFALVKAHVAPDLERIVRETDRFVVAEKREGTPAAVAEKEDPRG